MAKFSWEGTTRAGEKRRGVMEAESRAIVEERLRSDHINIQSVRSCSAASSRTSVIASR